MRRFLFNVVFYFVTTAFALCLQVGIFSSKLCLYLSHVWGSWSVKYITKIIGLTYQEKGLENIPAKNQGCIIASKHQSMWETMYFFAPFPRAAFAYKKELAYIPFWGWIHYYNRNIQVDRQNGIKAIKFLLKQAKERVADGRQVIIFPEGTRKKPGETGHKYHTSIYALYNQGITVIPVALNSGVYWPKGLFKQKPGVITVEYLPEMPKGLNRDEFMNELEKRIETASLALLKA